MRQREQLTSGQVAAMEFAAQRKDKREAFLQHEANLKAWAVQMKALKTELAEAEADGDQDAVEYVMRRYECWFFQRPMQKGE